MKTLKDMSISSTEVLLGIIWVLSADFVYSEWMPWYNEDFKPNPQLEDEYIYEYGNEDVDEDMGESNYQKWDSVRSLYEAQIVGKIIKLCMAAHKEAGRGNVSINAVKLNARKLTFHNPFYESREVDVLTYGVKNETDITTDWWDLVVGPENYITEGIRPDCVCYLTLLSSLKMEFSLYEHVCGINVTGITDVKSTRKKTPATTTTTKSVKGTKKSARKTTKTARKTTKKKIVTKKKITTKKATTIRKRTAQNKQNGQKDNQEKDSDQDYYD